MRKFRVYFFEGNDSVNVTSEIVEAHSFTAITVPSKIASTTVEFYDRYGKNLFMFAHAVKVAYEGEDQ